MVKKILLGSCFVAVSLMANQAPNGNIVPLGNVNGSTGNVFKDGKLRVAIVNKSFKKHNAYDGSREVLDPKKRSTRGNITKFVTRYGLGEGFDIRAVIPHIKKDTNMTNPMNGNIYKNSNSGVGDISLISRYEILNQKKGDGVFLSVGAGIKLPTGDTDKIFSTPQGDKKIPTMQLGSGSTDYLAEIGLTKILPNSRIDTHIMYRKANKGDNNYQFGDKIKWNIGYSYALNRSFDIQLELDGKRCDKHKNNGQTVNYTGGSFVYLTPGVHYKFSKRFDLSAGYAYMIKRDNNYDSATNTGGLSENSKFVFRVGYNF